MTVFPWQVNATIGGNVDCAAVASSVEATAVWLVAPVLEAVGPSQAQAVPVVALIVGGIVLVTFTGATALADCQEAALGFINPLCVFQ